jgi:transglutaminase-like putative cysteine protease
MIDVATTPVDDRLTLSVGCTVGLRSASPFTAVAQVAPTLNRTLSVRFESWDTDTVHHGYVDRYGNRCERFELPPGDSTIAYRALVSCSPDADAVVPDARESSTRDLDDQLLHFVLPSRFCLPDELGHVAWDLFGGLAPGWGRVQAVIEHVHDHIEFVPNSSNPWTTAADVYRARQGVCRDFAHVAITFCRALNIPARYVFGYIPDIGVPLPDDPMDFCAWFEVNLDGRWHTFDARLVTPRVGRVVVGRGRDAVDVAVLTSFGAPTLTDFQVIADVA